MRPQVWTRHRGCAVIFLLALHRCTPHLRRVPRRRRRAARPRIDIPGAVGRTAPRPRPPAAAGPAGPHPRPAPAGGPPHPAVRARTPSLPPHLPHRFPERLLEEPMTHRIDDADLPAGSKPAADGGAPADGLSRRGLMRWTGVAGLGAAGMGLLPGIAGSAQAAPANTAAAGSRSTQGFPTLVLPAFDPVRPPAVPLAVRSPVPEHLARGQHQRGHLARLLDRPHHRDDRHRADRRRAVPLPRQPQRRRPPAARPGPALAEGHRDPLAVRLRGGRRAS